MSANGGTVTVDFDAQTNGFDVGTKKVIGSLDDLAKRFVSFDQIAGAALGAFAGIAFTGLVKSAFESADALGDVADRAGIAVESLSRLKFVAEQNDVEFESLVGGLKKFQITLSQATSGSKEAASRFNDIRVSAEAIKNLSLEDQLAEVAEGFKRLKNPVDQTRLAAEIFGKSAGPELVPLLRQGRAGIAELTAEADRLGITLGGAGVASIDAADKAIKKLTATATAFGQKFVGGLALLIMGPQDEILKTDDRIRELTARRDQLLQGGTGKGSASTIGKSAFRAEIEKINEELEKLNSLQKVQLGLITPGKSFGPARRTGGVEFGSAVAPIDIKAIEALKIKPQEDVEQLRPFDQDILRAQASDNLRNAQLQVAEDFAEKQKQIEKSITASVDEEAKLRIQSQYDYRDAVIEGENAVLRVREAAAQNGIAALQAFAGGSKKIAIALVAIQKGRALVEAVQLGHVSIMQAAASAPPPYNAIPIAEATAFAALNVAAIAATAYGQVRQITSNGGAPLGSAVNPVSVSTGFDDQATAAADSKNVLQVVFAGPIFGNQETKDFIVDAIRDQVENRDVVIFSGGSTQAGVIRDGL